MNRTPHHHGFRSPTVLLNRARRPPRSSSPQRGADRARPDTSARARRGPADVRELSDERLAFGALKAAPKEGSAVHRVSMDARVENRALGGDLRLNKEDVRAKLEPGALLRMRDDASIRADREAEGAEDVTVLAPLALPVSWVIVDMRPARALLREWLPLIVGLLSRRGAEREREGQHKL